MLLRLKTVIQTGSNRGQERLLSQRRKKRQGVHALFSLRSFVAAVSLAAVLCVFVPWVRLPLHAQGALDASDEIVYIDSNGYVRVLDPDQTAGNAAVQWRSPQGDWYDAATGDVNGDGDAEIIAIGEGPEEDGQATVRVTVFDPVVTTGPLSEPTQRINDIPWEVLYTTTLPGDPMAVATGYFTGGQDQDAIVVGATLPDQVGTGDTTPSSVTLLDPTSADGRQWSVRFVRSFVNEWTVIRTGNADNDGVDEVLLLDRGLSELSIYRVDHEMSDSEDRIYRHESGSRKWNDGQIVSYVNDVNQLVSVRNAPSTSHNFEIAQYAHTDQLDWDTVETEWYHPSPERIISAKTTEEGQDIIYLLREVPAEDTQRPRLFVHLSHLGTDPQRNFQNALDSDNGYREGTNGDVIGNDNGMDELIIIRNNDIRVFTEPEWTEKWINYGRSTNVRTIHAADLDANGFFQRSRLDANPSPLDTSIAQGAISDLYTINLVDANEDLSIPFTYAVQGEPSWITVTASRSATPAAFRVEFDAQQLFPGEYRTAIDVTTTYEDVVSSELSIPITLTVTSGIGISPPTAHFEYYPCVEPMPVESQIFSVSGPGVEFDVRVSANTGSTDLVPWATVEAAGNTLPSTVTLTVDPNQRSKDREEAVLIVSQRGRGNEEAAPIYLLCARHRTYLPIAIR